MTNSSSLSIYAQRLLQLLARMAERRRTITYKQAARLVGMPHHRPLRTHLGELRDRCLIPSKAPLLNALVVRDDSGRPGDRFLPDGFPEKNVPEVERLIFSEDWSSFLRRQGIAPGRYMWAVQSKPHYIDSLEKFLNDGFVALGWPENDFQNLSRKEIRDIVRATDRRAAQATVTARVSAIESFVHHMSEGDLVFVPRGGVAWVGVIESNYYHDRAYRALGCSNMRAVRWLADKPVAKDQLELHLDGSLSFQFPPVISVHGDLDRIIERSAQIRFVRSNNPGRPIGFKAEVSHWMSVAATRREVERKHNSLTNDFLRAVEGQTRLLEAGYDLFAPDWNGGPLLIEAKTAARGTSGRHQIREAIGQLFDYQMGLEREGHAKIRLAVLVPEKPDADLMELLVDRLNIDVIWRDGARFLGTRQLARELEKLGG